MVSITLSVPEETRALMKHFTEINWSGFVRASIEQKVKQLSWRQEMLDKLKGEEAFTEWAVSLGRKAKKGRLGRIASKLSREEREELLRK